MRHDGDSCGGGAPIAMRRRRRRLLVLLGRLGMAVLMCWAAAAAAPVRAAEAAATGESPWRGRIPTGVEIVMDAEAITGQKREEYPVASNGVVLENWAAPPDVPNCGWRLCVGSPLSSVVVLHNIEESRFMLRSTKRRRFGEPVVHVSEAAHPVISPLLQGPASLGGELAPLHQKTAASLQMKELIVEYNCLREGQAKLLLVIPIAEKSKEEEMVAQAVREQIGGAADDDDPSAASSPAGMTPVVFTWSVTCGGRNRPGFTVQMAQDARSGEQGGDAARRYATAPAVVVGGATQPRWAVEVPAKDDRSSAAGPTPEHTSEAFLRSVGAMVPASPSSQLTQVAAGENVTRFVLSLCGRRPARGHQPRVGCEGARDQGQRERQLIEPARLAVTPEGICSPSIGGAGRKGATVAPIDSDADPATAGGSKDGLHGVAITLFGQRIDLESTYVPLDVRYNCFAPGTARITVVIPFPGGEFNPVIFTWNKVCGGHATKEISVSMKEDAKHPARTVIERGAPSPPWNGLDRLSYNPGGGLGAAEDAAAADAPAEVSSDVGASTFVLSKVAGVGPTHFGEPRLRVEHSDGHVLNPLLRGSGHMGGQLVFSHPAKSVLIGGKRVRVTAHFSVPDVTLEVVYNCLAAGKATLSLTVPLTLHNDLRWSWVKDCGGMARQQFTVSTFEAPVVRDGVAFDDWSLEHMDEPTAARVDSSAASLTFELALHDHARLTGSRSIGTDGDAGPLETSDWRRGRSKGRREKPSSQAYGQPRAQSSDPAVCLPQLGGAARHGGTLTSDGLLPQQLDVRFNCRKPGRAIVTVSIPVPAFQDVTFSFQKMCQLAKVEGWMVGAAPDDDSVVSNGEPWVYYDPSPASDGRRVKVDRQTEQTTFYVWLRAGAQAGDVVDFRAPIVTAVPSICAPRVGGELRKGGRLQAGGGAEALTVRYNCEGGGGTALITVRVESEDGTHDAVVWAWRKSNGEPAEKVLAIVQEERESHDRILAVIAALLGVMVMFLLVDKFCVGGLFANNKQPSPSARVAQD